MRENPENPRRITFFSVGALVDPINLLPFSLGKELGDERSVRDEIPRNRDAEFHRERPELRAKNPVLHHFCDFTGFVPASKGPGSEQLFVHWWSFLVPYPFF